MPEGERALEDTPEGGPGGVLCPVCREQRPLNEVCTLRCGHQLCARCLPQLQVGRCPICRQPIHPPEDPPDEPARGGANLNLLGIVGEGISILDAREPAEDAQEDSPPQSVDDLMRFSLQEFMDHIRDDNTRLLPAAAADPPGPPPPATPPRPAAPPPGPADDIAMVVVCRGSTLPRTLAACREMLMQAPPG